MSLKKEFLGCFINKKNLISVFDNLQNNSSKKAVSYSRNKEGKSQQRENYQNKTYELADYQQKSSKNSNQIFERLYSDGKAQMRKRIENHKKKMMENRQPNRSYSKQKRNEVIERLYNDYKQRAKSAQKARE